MCSWKEEEECGGGPLVFPRKWMLHSLPPTTHQLFKDDLKLFANKKDPAVVRVLESTEATKGGLEVTLDTSQYRPDELRINVEEEERGSNLVLVVEGRHKSEEGKTEAAAKWR